MLPALPCSLATRELGNAVVSVMGAARLTLRLAVDDPDVALHGVVTLVVPAGDRRQHEVTCRVLRRAGEHRWLAHPIAIWSGNGRRRSPRRASEHLAVIRPAHDGQPAGPEFDVRLIDLSGSGLAFSTDRLVEIGEEMACLLNFDDRLVFAHLQVTNLSVHAFGRRRIGCRIMEIAEDDREALTVYADRHALPDRRREAIEAVRAAVRTLATAG